MRNIMEGDENDEETYIEHLRSMFDELDSQKKGGLNRGELQALSEKLSLLKDQSELLLQLSFATDDKSIVDYEMYDEKAHVNFIKFQESFVAVLSATTDISDTKNENSESLNNSSDENLEIEPRVIRGDRVYGRRSQPDVLMEEFDHGRLEHNRTEEEENQSDSSEDSFQNEFYELPERGDGDKVYFEASGQLRNPVLDRLRPKSTSTVLNDSQLNSSSLSLVFESHHLFTGLDKDDIGLIDYTDLHEMWKKEGVADPKHVLQLLDVSIDDDKKVNAYDLTSTLENEATSLRLSTVDSLTQAVLATYKTQISHLNGQIETHQALLGKMKEDLEKSELRNSKLIDEVDDRYLHVDKNQEQILNDIEQQWTRKLKVTKRNFEKERELIQTEAMLERDALQQELERLTIREGSLRSTIDALQMDNDALEQETKDLVKKLQASENNCARLQIDLEQLLKEKSNAGNDVLNSSQEERFTFIIKDYEAQIRSLSDRNDELVAEVEKSRAEFLQLTRRKPSDEVNGKGNSRKRARRRGLSAEYIDRPGDSGSEQSDIEDDERTVELSNKIANMEKNIQRLEEEKSLLTKRFTEEKTLLRNQIESEFQDKLDEERKKLISFKELTKSDKNTAINQALTDSRKQREELEKQLSELKKVLETEQMNGQQTVSNLCREFEVDKAEIQNRNEEAMLELRDEANDLQQQLEKEIEAHEMTSQQLQADRQQHKATLQAHTDTINKLEKGAKQINSEEIEEVKRLKSRLHQLEEELLNHENNKRKIEADHEIELELVKTEMQTRMNDFVMEKRKQDQSTLSSELERMHENVSTERDQMQERIINLRQSFEAEAEELKTLVEMEKCEIKKILAEESAALKKKLSEESEKAVKKKQQEMQDEERSEHQTQIQNLEEIIKNLQASKTDYERELRDSHMEKKNLESKIASLNFEKETSFNSLQTQTMEDEKDKLNAVLQSQISELRMKHLDSSQELLHVKTQYDAKQAEIELIGKEKQRYAEKIQELENAKSTMQVENARLISKNIELGKSEVEALADENDKQIVELNERLTEREAAFSKLQEKFKKLQSVEDSTKIRPEGDAQTKYEHARQQLVLQMNKTKEMYSKLARGESLIKDLYCENSQLMHALQLTEDRYKSSERRIMVETDKNVALTLLLRKICPEAV